MTDLAFVLRTSMEMKPRIGNEAPVTRDQFYRIFHSIERVSPEYLNFKNELRASRDQYKN